ncbi:collagen-binding domain-containing protein [Photobacterium minamisatsumaniensis]|uniref:collagen-binding domain-containing protein n=1 Tax=Photobacterium minamisatsumaniensis TaxID=2910233 RepID=UPI003D0B2662
MLKPTSIFLTALCFVCAPSLLAGPIDLLNNYQLIVFNDLESTSEVDGKALIMGDLNGTASNYTTQQPQALANEVGLVVGGDLNVNVQVNNGYSAIVGGNNNGVVSLNGVGGVLTSDTSSYNFAQIQTDLLQYSSFLASLSSNSLLTQPSACCGNASFDVGSSVGHDLAVFNIDSSDLFENPFVQSYSLNLNTQAPSAIVINVAGTDIDDSTYTANAISEFVNSAISELIIWNFHQSETLNLTKAIYGNVLAPLATLTNHTEIKGSVVVNKHYQYGKIWGPIFSGAMPDDTPFIPEPTTSSVIALGLFVLGWRQNKKLLL